MIQMQTELNVVTNLFVCKHVEVDGISLTPMQKSRGEFTAIRVKTDEGTILLDGIILLREKMK